MRVSFDIKLLQHIRYSFEKQDREAFCLFGKKESDELLIIAGWFESDGIVPPVSDLFVDCGTLAIADRENREYTAWTNREILFSTDPLRFPHASAVRYFDTRKTISDLSIAVCLSFQPCESSSIYSISPNGIDKFVNSRFIDLRDDGSHQNIPLFSVQEGNEPVCISQILCTENSKSEIGPASYETRVGIFMKHSSVGACMRSLISPQTPPAESYSAMMNWSYLHIPVFSQKILHYGNFRGALTNRLISAHTIIRNHPEDAIICQNRYEYFHYNMDSVKDAGWGCAYRSIQTLASWFYNNSDCVERILSIPEMQGRLRAVDYAHSDLEIGSNRWIGCFEASTLLSDMSSGRVSSRILHASSLPEMKRFVFDEVKKHLVEIGSPVIVGAGDFAFTIIGVSSEASQVLILDPHYSGSDSQNSVSKGFIAWKDFDKFFAWNRVSSGFINICLPFLV